MLNSEIAIWWIRRDLRLADNPALTAALAQAPTVVPVFILDPVLLGSRYHQQAHKRLAFLFGGLQQLDSDLRALGSRLILRQGRPLEVLAALIEESGATAIFAAEDMSPVCPPARYACRQAPAAHARQ